jgi:hypothetical protein
MDTREEEAKSAELNFPFPQVGVNGRERALDLQPRENGCFILRESIYSE